MAESVAQFKEFIKNYNRLSGLCFDACIWNFTSRDISSKEDGCINNCFEKFVKSNQRMAQRFQEHQLQAHEGSAAQNVVQPKIN